MQLHILGPAFGLPSIDAECIAAVALLQSLELEEWEAIPTADLSRRLPRLSTGNKSFEGFQDIAAYLNSLQIGRNISLIDTQHATSVAISSFVRAHGQPLLDISLYVSSENYSNTRSAFTKILPWYANYLLPPKRREEARNRTQHLGISSIDVENVHEDLSNRPPGFDTGKEPEFEAETQKRASLLLPSKTTVRSLLQRPEHSAVFKLHAVADNFFGPLQDWLDEKPFFLGTSRPTALDCLIYGYLSLMLYPKPPQDWLAKTMRRKYTRLVRFTERMHESLKMQTNVEDVIFTKSRSHPIKTAIPWGSPPATHFPSVAKSVLYDLAALIPILRPFQLQIIQSKPVPAESWPRKYLPTALAATTTSLGLLAYYAFSTGWLIWPHGEAVHIFGRKRFSDYGHLGAALAGISLLGQHVANDVTLHPQDTHDRPTRVEVEVEKDVAP